MEMYPIRGVYTFSEQFRTSYYAFPVTHKLIMKRQVSGIQTGISNYELNRLLTKSVLLVWLVMQQMECFYLHDSMCISNKIKIKKQMDNNPPYKTTSKTTTKNKTKKQ